MIRFLNLCLSWRGIERQKQKDEPNLARPSALPGRCVVGRLAPNDEIYPNLAVGMIRGQVP